MKRTKINIKEAGIGPFFQKVHPSEQILGILTSKATALPTVEEPPPNDRLHVGSWATY